ncbi:MAG: YhdH/YhfP family quinone oxidoreductase [Pseudomonadota bacterium]|nr:YhdH/YhfP family quinone oxidoreductase [Pseudomonadota bacterium]
MTAYRAFRIRNDDDGYRAGIEELPLAEPAEGEVRIRVAYSSVNYKDALAGTGKGKILKTFPLVGGIDAAGRVESSRDERFREGDPVLVTGFGLSFDHDGGYGESLCVPADWVVPIPDGLDPHSAMILGTAGFTAALAIHRMQVNGQRPDMGPVLVTGATGGVGSIAVDLFKHLGYEVTAVSGKQDLDGWLQALGASAILGRNELPGDKRPLETAVWGGAVDNVGGEMLAQITRTVRPWGNIASVGLAGGHELHTTVMPFILRGVSLLGINSAGAPYPLRRELWERLATDWRPPHLMDILTARVALEALAEVFDRMLKGRTHGRVLVHIESS